MTSKNELIESLKLLHTTPMGRERIRKNLLLGEEIEDEVTWCRKKILLPEAALSRRGKNWYIEIENCIITVNAYSYTIITAHKK